MKSSSDEQVGALIKRLREERQLSQNRIAVSMRECGLGWYQNTVSRVESGVRPLHFKKAVALFDLLGVKISDIKDGTLAEPVRGNYEITVSAFNMTEWQSDALFTRVADAAHARDEEVTCTIGPLCEECET